MKRFVWVFVLLCLLPAVGQAGDPLKQQEPLHSILQQKVPDDDVGAYKLLWQMYDANGVLWTPSLRTWLWRRDLTRLEGGTPPSMTVEQAIDSPLADGGAYREAAMAYVAERFSIRLAVDGVAGIPPGTIRSGEGIYVTRAGDHVFVGAVVTNRGSLNAELGARVQVDDASLSCAPVQISAGGVAGTWCRASGPGGTVAGQVAYIVEALKHFDGIVKRVDLATGDPTRHVMADSGADYAPPWETALGVRELAGVEISNRIRAIEAARSPVPTTAWAVLVVIAALLATGGTAHYNSAHRAFLPRGLFVGYVILVVVALCISGLDESTGAPMKGVLSLMAQMVVGLPWSLSLLSPDNRLPNGSGFPWLFAAGNAALLFVFSSPGRRYEAG
ncbi:hypothetical protein [Luteibacter sp. 22Crub2.1]|uniref:hypothetical protein n=1 Tax=Luteibacter sp. 22Crub2.1 TaxID=1283288 RepID=UPI0009A60BA7|nr:hypothetical protein [Luteibacter sp. 22Crub2.1]SKB74673.1 hypothetical protein SAMN05660880_02418 [Luteibacter sp. 22Crub2.1]